MTGPAQRDEWAEHLKDEARAIAQQQVSAGVTHEPVSGPLPYTQDQLTAAVAAAVLSERERCVELVQSIVTDPKLAQAIIERLRSGPTGPR